jgi:hypothetical protein
MYQSDFIAACLAATVDPAIALEDDEVRKAITECDDEAVYRALRENF